MRPLDGTCHYHKCTKPSESEFHRYCIEHGEAVYQRRARRRILAAQERARREQITDYDVVVSGGDTS